jgi:hypothetical protein
MLDRTKNAAVGMMLGALLLAGTTVQASAQATQDTSKAQDTSAYSAPQPADTGAPVDTSAMKADTSAMKAGEDSTGMSKMSKDSAWTDTSKKAWKKDSTADSSSDK